MAAFMRFLGEIFHPLTGIHYSIKGVWAAFRDECSFRHEVVLGLIHYGLLFGFVHESWEFKLLLASLWPVLMAMELVNTAIESVTDLASPERRALAAKAKDCASAAVMMISALLLVLWAVVGYRAWF